MWAPCLHSDILYLVVAVFISFRAIIAPADAISLVQQSNRWQCQVYHASCQGNDVYYSLPCAWPGDTFILSVRVVDRLTNQPSRHLARHLQSHGIGPYAHIDERAYISLSNSQINNSLTVFRDGAWQIPFVASFSGQTKVTIYSHIVSSAPIDDLGYSVVETVADTVCLVKSSPSLRSDSCTPPSFQLPPALLRPLPTGVVRRVDFTHSPAMTSDALIVIGDSPMEIVYSPGDQSFQNAVLIRLPESVLPSANPICSTNTRAAILVPDGLLVSSGSGVLHYEFAPPDRPSAAVSVLSACVDVLAAPVVEMNTGSAVSSVIMASNATNIWWWDPKTSAAFQALDTAAIGQRQLAISAAFSDPTVQGGSFALCRFRNGTAVLLYQIRSSWEQRFQFPATVRRVMSLTPIVLRLIPGKAVLDSALSVAVGIKQVVPSRHPGKILYAWGSVLLISRTSGRSFYVMYTGDNITSFDSAIDGTYAFLTTTNRLYYGHIDSWRVAEIRHPNLTAPDQIVKVFFDGQNALRIAFASNGSTADQLVVSDRLQGIIHSSLYQDVLINGLMCPYRTLLFKLNDDSLAADRIDQPIFIDYLDQVNITIIAQLNVDPSEFSMGISDDRLGYVTVSLERTATYLSTNSVVYNLVVQDSGQYFTMSESGRNLRHTPIRLFPLNATSACTQLESTFDQVSGNAMIKSAFSYDINVYSGCPPGIIPALNITRTLGNNQCVESETDQALCFPFSSDFQLSVDIFDDISGVTSAYDGPITFTVLGAGTTPDSIERFDATKVLQFNSGLKSIWTFTNSDSSNVLSTNSTISWQCPTGSPCSAITPDYPNAPAVFLLARISSTTSAAQMTSYCSNSMEVLIYLHGLPMDATIMLSIAVIVTIVIFLLVALVFVCNRKSIIAIKPQLEPIPNDISHIHFRDSLFKAMK